MLAIAPIRPVDALIGIPVGTNDTDSPNEPWQDIYMLPAFAKHAAAAWRHLDHLERRGAIQFDAALMTGEPFSSRPTPPTRIYRNPLDEAPRRACRSPPRDNGRIVEGDAARATGARSAPRS